MGCPTLSGPVQLPTGTPAEEIEISSLRGPDGYAYLIWLCPVANACSVTFPVSSSEPAMRRAVPVSVASETAMLAAIAARACCKRTGPEAGATCWDQDGTLRSRRDTPTPPCQDRMRPPQKVISSNSESPKIEDRINYPKGDFTDFRQRIYSSGISVNSTFYKSLVNGLWIFPVLTRSVLNLTCPRGVGDYRANP